MASQGTPGRKDPGIDQMGNIGMFQAGKDSAFPAKQGTGIGMNMGERFERNLLAQIIGATGKIDPTHPAYFQFLFNSERST